MQILRKILFYFFVSLYLVLCPVTILYALGYIWRPGGEEALVKTGLIYLSTMPSGASVSLGKNPPADKTPTVLRDLVPGNYTVTLEFEGRRPWSQTLPVEAEKATVLEKILLLPERLPVEEPAPGSFDNLIAVNGTRFLILLKGQTRRESVGGQALQDAAVYDTKERKLKALVSEDSGLGAFHILSFTAQEETPYVLLHARAEKEERYLWIRLEGSKAAARDVSDLFPEEPEIVSWEAKERETLFSFRDHSLNRLDASSKAIYPKILRNIHGFGFLNKKIYLLGNDNHVRIADNEGKIESMVPYNALSGSVSLKEKYFYRLHPISEEDILLLGEKGDLWTNESPRPLAEDGVLGLEIYAPAKKALAFRRDRIGVVEFPQRSVLEKTPKENPKIVWVHSGGRDIEQAFWLYEGSHILFRDGDKVKLLGLETYGEPHLDELLRVKPGTGIAYFEPAGEIYYLDGSSGCLSAAEILPRPFQKKKKETPE